MARRVSIHAAAAFALALGLCLLLVSVLVSNRVQIERLTMERLISEKSARINAEMARLLFGAHTLSSYIVYNDGEVGDFARIASTIIDDPSILNMLVAPGGVVSDIYPMEGNEAVLGLDFFADGAGNREAVMARETGRLVLGGPFEGVQGGQILVGRLPVFLAGDDGGKNFWGIASVTLKHPDALRGAGLAETGFDYEIWRRNPDDGGMQFILGSDHRHRRYVETPVSILGASWYFRILPVRAWHEFPETWVSVFVGIIVSFMAAAVVQRNRDLKRLRDKLAVLSNTDALTGINNRRFFMETVPSQMDRVARQNSESFVILMDLDNFKCINDRHGHLSGDMVLKEVAARVTSTLRPYDLFARYGGEEFILFVTDMDKASAIRLAERIRAAIAETPIPIVGTSAAVTASLGVAPATPANRPEDAIACADKALYMAKDAGRNAVMYYDKEGEK